MYSAWISSRLRTALSHQPKNRSSDLNLASLIAGAINRTDLKKKSKLAKEA
jgi:hypothetical protein